jgi:ubiquinone/menaquinone biosynthesis C-methylase UbiE
MQEAIRRKKKAPTSLLSTPTIHRTVLEALAKVGEEFEGDYLDVGSGEGRLLQPIAERYKLRPFACDYTERLMKIPGQRVEIVDLNRQPLPYAENQFVLVTCAETIEHLDNFRAVLREIFRVLQPGGWVVITTPNILNLRSRLRYLTFGFHNLFGPLAVGEEKIHNTHGHISPVGWFYLAHALLNIGFHHLELSVDHYQRRSIVALPLFYLPIRLGAAVSYYREVRRTRTINVQNRPLVRAMSSLNILLGRTLIVAAQKPLAISSLS